MPLTATDYTWTQTESSVSISINLKGVKVHQVDIVSTDEYIKVHFPPYMFEAFLFKPVDDVRGTAKVGNGVVLFTLQKKNKEMWEQLMITTYDKEKQQDVRESALVKYRETLSSQSKSKASQRHAERQYALETMMKLDQKENDAIQKAKDAERENAAVELEAWRSRQRKGAAEDVQSQRDIPNKLKSMTEEDDHGGTRDSKIRKDPANLPAQRHFGNIQVRFTPRVFPTPLRESRIMEEEEWKRKQAEARCVGSTEAEELTGKEHDADWLKDKGDKCFVIGDYLGAVNAYSLAIRLNRKIPALYSNRAACHLKLRNLHKAVEDSSQALNLLTPPVAANAAARTRAHVRRGSAFCELQLYAEGLQDYQAALKLDPHNEVLQADVQRVRDRIQGSDLNMQ